MAINRDDHQSVSQMICFHQRARQPLLHNASEKKKKNEKMRVRARGGASKESDLASDNHRKSTLEQHTTNGIKHETMRHTFAAKTFCCVANFFSFVSGFHFFFFFLLTTKHMNEMVLNGIYISKSKMKFKCVN
jgi:hypothetical protein